MSPAMLTSIADHVHRATERIRADLTAMVAFNSVHGDSAARPDYEACARWVARAFSDAGIDCTTLTTSDDSLAVVGQRPAAPGYPTVLLYSHLDVVPAGPREDWDHDPLTLTDKPGPDGAVRWHGRGTADCKGNIAMHLAALRALHALPAAHAPGSPADPDSPTPGAASAAASVGIKIIVEGSEENGGEGLSDLLRTRPDLFAADAILVADTGNATCGHPSLITVLRGSAQVRVTCKTLESAAHSGKFGGAAPDAVAALIRTLDSLRDAEGRTLIDGVDCTGSWTGEPYPAAQFRADAGVLPGAEIMGEPGRDRVADMIWARPAVTITGFSSTPVEDAVNSVPPHAQAQLNLRVPPHQLGTDGTRLSTRATAEKLAAHLHAHVPWGAQLDVEILDVNRSFSADEDGPAMALLRACLGQAYGMPAHALGTGGSIPLTIELHEHFPHAEIALFGVADAGAAIHSPDESVDPREIEHMAIAEALFLASFTDPAHTGASAGAGATTGSGAFPAQRP